MGRFVREPQVNFKTLYSHHSEPGLGPDEDGSNVLKLFREAEPLQTLGPVTSRRHFPPQASLQRHGVLFCSALALLPSTIDTV